MPPNVSELGLNIGQFISNLYERVQAVGLISLSFNLKNGDFCPASTASSALAGT